MKRQINVVRDRIKSAHDIEITRSDKGVIHKAPNGTKHRVTVTNAGSLEISEVTS